MSAAAYRSCEKIKNLATGKIHDFRRKSGLLHQEIFTPEKCPDWAKDRAKLWNEVEKKENRSNSQFAKSFEIALHSELTLEQNLKALKGWILENITTLGLIADVAIHDENDGNKNVHAHVLVTTRKIDQNGWTKKAFEKLPQEHKWLDKCRESWEFYSNQQLRIKGKKVSHKSLKEQGIDRKPGVHKGPHKVALERKMTRLQTVQNTSQSPEKSPQMHPKYSRRQDSWEY